MHKRLLVSIFISFIFSLQGVGEEISFNHLTTEDGLSNNSVMSMYQDERGFIWIGTRNGVNLYNGRNFNVNTIKTIQTACIITM